MATSAVVDARLPEPSAPSEGARREPDSGQRLRVAFCLDGLGVGGTELNAVRTLERLPRDRFDLTLVTLTADGPLRQRVEAAGVHVVSLPISGLFSRDALRQGTRLRRLLRERRIEVVHSHDMYTNVFATAAARAARTPVVITSRRWHAFERASHRAANAVAFHASDCVVANSAGVAALTHREERVPRRRLAVIPNFVDEAAFDAPSPVERARLLAELGVPEGALTVGVIANLWTIKDQATLVEALALLGDRCPDAHVVLVGEGPCRPALVALAESLGVGDRVHLAGRRPHLPNLHHLFDVSALTSTTEGFPNTLVEAMAAARPIVATRVGGVPDAVEEGVSGYLVPPRSPRAIAEALAPLLADAGLRQRMGAAGRARAVEHHSPAVALTALEQLYLQLLQRHGARAAKEA